MGENGVFVFPDAATRGAANGIDPGLLALLNQNGGFGGNGSWMWLIFLWMMWSRNGNGFGFDGNGTGFLANQANQEAGTNLIIQALNGRADALGQIAQLTNNSVETVKSTLAAMNTSIATLSGNVGLTGQQIISQILSGNATLGRQLCECCCENRLAICQQTNALQSQMAQNAADVRLQLAQNEAADQLSVCQQTNTITRQADTNTNSIVKAIADQNAMIVKEFCDLKERELQNKIDTQGDIITQLRNQISNDKQTLQFNAAFHALDDKIDAIAAKQPNTVPITWPNLTAVNNTPYAGGYPYGFGYGNGFGGGIVF